MKTEKLFLILGLALFFVPDDSHGQVSFEGTKLTGEMFLRKIVPPSPTAASLGKYGDQQVNLFSGMPSVSIPIYEVKNNGISAAISLSYSTSGLKVSEAASWVGLGWTLNATGVITRVVRGVPDFTGTKDYFNVRTFPLPRSYAKCSDAAWDYLHGGIYDHFDPEPDMYMVHAGNINFKFFYDMNKRIQTIPYNNRIRINYNSSTAQYEITDDEGTIYYFGGSQAIETTTPEGAGASPYTSSWYLTKISAQTGAEINYTYTIGTAFIEQDQFSESEEVKPVGSNTGDCSIPSASGRVTQFSSQSILPCFLNTIDAPNEIVYFIRDVNQRADLPGDYSLKEIKVYSKSKAKNVFNYSFDYSYFPQVSTYCWGYSNGNTTHPHDAQAVCKRLRLDKFTEKGDETNTVDFKVYQFQYSSDAVPARCSLDQDHWGYYNGAGNISLLPPTTEPVYPSSSYIGNREANENYADAGMLLKIIYPTGGESDFVYEPNKVETVVTGQSPQTAMASLSGASPLLENSVSFTITNTYQRPVIKFNLEDAELIDQGLQRKVEIRDQAGVLRWSAFNYNSGDNGIVIPSFPIPSFEPGTYIIKVLRNYVYSSYPNVTAKGISATLYFNTQTTSTLTNRTAGGFRVKRITDKTGSTGGDINVKEFIYEQPYLIANIVNDDYKATYIRSFINSLGLTYRCDFLSRNSTSVQPVGTIQGANIGYGKVTTLYGTNGTKGKTEQYFSVDPDQGGYSLGPINQPVTSYDHRRGNLLKQIDYNSTGDILKITNNTYTFVTKNICNFYRPYYKKDDPVVYGIIDHSLDGYKEVVFSGFSLLSEWTQLKNSSETIFAGGKYLTTTKEYSYGNVNHMLLTQTKTINSKGESKEINMTYPLDDKPSSTKSIEEIERNFETDYTTLFNNFLTCDGAATTTAALGTCYTNYQTGYDNLINTRTTTLNTYSSTFNTLANNTSDGYLKAKYSMIAKNILTENIQLTETKNNTTQLKKKVTDFYTFGTSILPKNINTATFQNTLQTEAIYDYSDIAKGQPRQITPKNGAVTSFLWDYNQTYLVAQATNASWDKIAYTSFETDNKGGWGYSGIPSAYEFCPTGKKIYNLSQGNITRTISASTTYFVSFWYASANPPNVSGANLDGYPIKGKTINGWTYYEYKFTGVTNFKISGVGGIDELRLYPDGAQMTTSTFEPLIGMTSQCDINNKITYYEYDKSGRLRVVRDQDNNVLKKICYNYAGQQTDCDYFYNQAKSKTFISNQSCTTGKSGSEVTYTVAAGKYSSVSSQAATDQLATNDINTNGQTYANANGVCLSNVGIKSGNWDIVANYRVTYTSAYDASKVYVIDIPSPNPAEKVTLTPSIPQGTYTVWISYNGQGIQGSRAISIGPSPTLTKLTNGYNSAIFYNVVITANASNEIAIGYEPQDN